MKFIFFLGLIFSSGVSLSATPPVAHIIDLANQDTKVTFLAIGKPSLMKISGTGGKILGEIQAIAKSIKGNISVNNFQNYTWFLKNIVSFQPLILKLLNDNNPPLIQQY